MLTFSTRLIPAVAAAALLAGLAVSPASAARARHHHAQPVQEQDFMATVPVGPETSDPNCYPTRIQVPTVSGLQWEYQNTCPYADN
ncbi:MULTISPECIES: hypothetical protein [unclassified Beijerinckia]|uniref:hypothetical protein n=1 Tax=unclassified Beijerinckia TaxID=2638183 RepID=UPI00089C0052|nr:MULTISPECIES: hypothetical protein [unclassified Beijerinckia]MDH7798236.1 hypothetical protein [Beijerinckia sp. GAS462]SED13881.1 hypothetical protein SAMN05443249_4530 [Beijerinckia sp. 28-YEA-48]